MGREEGRKEAAGQKIGKRYSSKVDLNLIRCHCHSSLPSRRHHQQFTDRETFPANAVYDDLINTVVRFDNGGNGAAAYRLGL